MYKLFPSLYQVDVHLSSICEALIQVLDTSGQSKALIRVGGAKEACPFKACTNNVGFILKCVHIKLHRLLNEVRGVTKEVSTCYHGDMHTCTCYCNLESAQTFYTA